MLKVGDLTTNSTGSSPKTSNAWSTSSAPANASSNARAVQLQHVPQEIHLPLRGHVAIGFVATFTWWSVPVVMLVFYILVSVELIAEEIEDPFGVDENDLPLDGCAKPSGQRGRNSVPRLTLLHPFAMKTIDLNEKYALINSQWTPHVVAELNGQQVKLAKIEGVCVACARRRRRNVLRRSGGAGNAFSRFRAARRPGQMIVVPGVEHCPVAAPDA